jgi:hypothetical protein
MTHLAGDSTFEKDGRVVIDKLKLLEDVDSGIVIGQKFQILIGKREFQRGQTGFDHLDLVQSRVLPVSARVENEDMVAAYMVFKVLAKLTAELAQSIEVAHPLPQGLLEFEIPHS